MKYFFGTLALIAIIFSYAPAAHADSVSCSVINSGTYSSCCTSVDLNTAVGKACTAYYYTQTAPAATSCSAISANNYRNCCTNVDPNSATGTSCTNYFYSSGMATAPQQVGGSLHDGPVNSTNVVLGATPAATADPAATACSAIKFKTLLDIAIWIKCIIGSVIVPGIFTLAFVVFLWGVLKFMRSSEQKDKQESKQFIYMGLIGLFVMTSVWGIIKIFATTLGIETVVPTLQTTSLDIKNASK